MLTFTTDYDGLADSALRRAWLHHQSPSLKLCAFSSLTDVAKGGDGAKSALREIFLRFPGRAPWSAKNILAETILVARGNANESIDT
jgi:hypothetical protein